MNIKKLNQIDDQEK